MLLEGGSGPPPCKNSHHRKTDFIRALYPTINSNVTKRKTGNLYSTIMNRIRFKKRLFMPTIACVHNIRHIRNPLHNVNKSYSK